MVATAQQAASDCATLPGWDSVVWDPTASAGSYATFAALLAGFSLSGLLWISSSAQTDRISKSSAVVGIWASLVPLVLATLLFAEIQGDAKCEQALIETQIALLLLTIGTVTLFVSLGQLLARVFDEAADQLARLVSWIALALGAAGIYAGNSTMLTMLEGDGWDSTGIARVQLALVATSLIVAFLWKQPLRGVGPLVYVVVLGAFGFAAFYFTAFENPDWMAKAVSWGRVLMWCVFAVAAASVIRTPPQTLAPIGDTGDGKQPT